MIDIKTEIIIKYALKFLRKQALVKEVQMCFCKIRND